MRTVQVGLGMLSLLLVLAGDRLSVPFLGNLGIACLGLTSIAIGWEAIIKRHIVVGRRRHGNWRTYTDFLPFYRASSLISLEVLYRIK